MIRVPYMKQVAWYLVFAMFVMGMVPRVEAGLSPSEAITLSHADRQADLEKIQKVIETKMVSERLSQYGLTGDEINARLSGMSNQQIHSLALQLDDLRIGGDGVGVVAAVLAVVILILILVFLLHHRVAVR